jgi:predicted DNA-binding protein (MmcQ/YjbR family)
VVPTVILPQLAALAPATSAHLPLLVARIFSKHRARPETARLPEALAGARLRNEQSGGADVTQEKFNIFCRSLPATSHVVQWGGADVWKVGGKVFVVAHFDGERPTFSFKVTPLAFEMLKEQPGLRPAPYLASRGMSWIQHYEKPGLSDAELKDYLRQSHRLVAQGLSKKMQKELGLAEL